MSFPYITDLLNAILGVQWSAPIPTFGVVVALAILIATGVARAEARRLEAVGRLPRSAHLMVGDLALVSVLAGLVGARVFDILDHVGQFMADPIALILTRSGFSIYGGLCFGVLAGVLFLRQRGIPIRPMLDAAAPALMLGYGIGRLGCDWGTAADMTLKPSWLPDWLWAQTYDGNIIGAAIAAPGVHPTPIYETLAALILFCVLWLLRSDKQRPGYLFYVYLLLAGFERLLVEKIRINPKYDFLGVRITQAEAISLFIIIGGLVGVLFALRGRRLWMRILLTSGVVAALSACAPL